MDDDPDRIIPDEDYLLRGIPPDQWHFPKGRPSTGALDTQELSVDWTKYRTVDEFMARNDRLKLGHGLLRFRAALPRSLSLTVRYDPKPQYDPDNDAHALVFGDRMKSLGAKVKDPTVVELLIKAQQLSVTG
ncbi:MAG TPA: hypothetical protein V6D08_21570 [Candidatus Obscuribacterales bacterium]